MKSGWKSYLTRLGLILLGGLFVFLTIETYEAKNMGFETKTYWDWMELLIIPLFLASGAFFLNRSEKEIERNSIEKRAELEHEIAKDRQQEAALQAYIDKMSDLLLEKKLRTTKNQEVRNLARTRTISVMRILNTERKNLVIQFLHDAKLINDENSILANADFHDMDLRELYLFDTVLPGALFLGADMRETSFSGAFLAGAHFPAANLENADLEDAILAGAILMDTDLRSANLEGAYLEGANLERANLNGANLKGTNLKGAIVSQEQLAIAKSLKGAIMPDGTKHE